MNENEEIEKLDLFVWSDEDLAKPKTESPTFGYLKSIGTNFNKIKSKFATTDEELLKYAKAIESKASTAENPSSFKDIALPVANDGMLNINKGTIDWKGGTQYEHIILNVEYGEEYIVHVRPVQDDIASVVLKKSDEESLDDIVQHFMPVFIEGEPSNSNFKDIEIKIPFGVTKMYVNRYKHEANNYYVCDIKKKVYTQLKDSVEKNTSKINEIDNKMKENRLMAWKNVIAKSEPHEDYLMKTDGELFENNASWYKHNEYAVPAGSHIRFCAKGMNATCPAAIWFDSNNNYLGSYDAGSTDQLMNIEIQLPENAVKVVLNGVNNSIFSLEYLEELSLKDTNSNPLVGKKICANGDSIMFGAGYTGGFLKIIADRNNMELSNIAVSGGTLTSGSNTNVHHICDTITDMDNDGDYYIVEGGYNDYLYHTNGLGEITDGYDSEIVTTTVCGAMERICRQLISNFGTKKLGFVITHKILTSSYVANTLGITMQDIHDAIIKVCKKYSIPVCDLFEESILNTAFENYLNYTRVKDGVHPTKTGYELFYCDKVENWLKTL